MSSRIRAAILSTAMLCCTGSALAGAYEDFFKAIELDDSRRIEALLAQGFDPNAPDGAGQSGLFLALRGSAVKSAKILIAHPLTKVDARNENDESPLMMAALRGHLALARELLDRLAGVNKPGWSPLHYAATGPEPEIVKLLVERGANLGAESPNRTTPLMMAARYGAEPSVDLLLSRGANPKARNDQDLGAADFAKLAGRATLAARLAALDPR
jgi:uncharacterized protein